MLKFIYNIIPFKAQLFKCLKLFYSPNESIFKHLNFKGKFTVKINETTSFEIMHFGNVLENELFWMGIDQAWEKESLQLWVKLCQKATTVFDIGANTGIYALIAKSLNPSAKVYAFEPVKRVYDKLVFNNKLNHFDIQCRLEAVSDKTGKAVIYDIPEMEHIYSVTVNRNMADDDLNTVETEIDTITLDDVINQDKINNIDLIKIDVETHEPEVIKGYINHLKDHRPTFLIEVLDDGVGASLEEQFKDLDYIYFNIDEKAGAQRVENITKRKYFNYLICSEKVAKELNLLPKK